MTYYAYLAIFLGIPLALLSYVTIRDYQRGKWQPSALNSWQPWRVIVGLCVVAFAYTTPWDNYLVATGVWWYDLDLVTGIVIGYVPIEEYTFFILLPIFSGLWTLLLMRNMANPKRLQGDGVRIRVIGTAIIGIIWAVSCVVLVMTFVDPEWKPWTYLGLELSWALIPVMIQMAFGADILWRHRRMIAVALLTSTVYLAATDAVAISAGTWTIDPAQSLPILIGGILPIEELLFFFLVNVLVVLGLTLVLAEESQERAIALEKYAILRPLAQWLKRQMKAEG